MTTPPPPLPFAYIQSDIPAGMTVDEWRRRRTTPPRHPRLAAVGRRFAGLAR